MKTHLIVNPNAGRRNGLALAESVRKTLASASIEASIYVSTYPGETVELAGTIARQAAAVYAPEASARSDSAIAPQEARSTEAVLPSIIAVGGDGTLFEMLNGLMTGWNAEGIGSGKAPDPIPFPIGQIPVGTGNSFIRDLGIETPDEAAEAIMAGTTRAVDLGTFSCSAGRFVFINLLGAGFVSSVAHRAARYKRWGSLSYVIGVLQETLALAPGRLTLHVDGTTIQRDALFVEICNSRYTGGEMCMAPGAKIDDGLLDVVVMTRATRRKLLTLFPKIFSGTHVEDPVIEVFQGRSVRVETEPPWLLTPDGEIFDSTPIDVSILPGHLRMYHR